MRGSVPRDQRLPLDGSALAFFGGDPKTVASAARAEMRLEQVDSYTLRLYAPSPTVSDFIPVELY